MSCAFGSDMSLYRAWHDSGRPQAPEPEGFPLLEPRFAALPDDPLSVFLCLDEARCPGGPPGTCGPNLQVDVISCAHCKDEWFWDGVGCAQCSAFELSSVLFPTLPLLLGPVVIALLYYSFRDDVGRWSSWSNGLASVGFISLNHYQVTKLANSANVQKPPSVSSWWGFWSWSDDFLAFFRPQCAGFAQFEKMVALRTLGPVVMALVFVLTFAASHLVHVLSRRPVGMNRDRTLNIYFSVIFTFFAGISSMCLMVFKCHQNPNGTRTLNKDESILCGEPAWDRMVGVAAAAVVVYIIGFGSLFVWAIVSAPRLFGQAGFNRRWKFLLIKYRADVYWWSVPILLKGLLLNIGFIFLDLGIAQINWVMGITGVYLAACVAWMPWRHRIVNALDVAAHLFLLFVLSLLTWYAHDAVTVESEAKEISDDIGVAILVVNAAPLALALPVALWLVAQQQLPSVQARRAEDTEHMCQAFRTLVHSSYDAQVLFMARLDDWDRHHLLMASAAVQAELLGKSKTGRRRTGTGQLLADSLEVQAQKISGNWTTDLPEDGCGLPGPPQKGRGGNLSAKAPRKK